MIAAVTLDATGTLFAPRDLATDYARILARHGTVVAREELARLLPEVWREFACAADPARDRFATHPQGARGFWREVVERTCARAGAGRPSRFAVAELFERFAEAGAWRVYEEVPAALAALAARGLRLAVISNWDERLPRLLSGLGLAPSFETVVVSAAVGVEKPHPRIFAVAAERLGLAPERLLHVGDRRLEDVEGARAAGMQALLLDRDGDDDGDLAHLGELAARCAALA